MKRVILISIACIMLFSITVPAELINDATYLKNTLSLMADKTLEAYNYNDYLAFFRYYSNTLSQLKTKKYFDNLFVSVYKDKFGDILSKELIEEKSSFDPYYPRLAYQAVCRKVEKVLITIYFQEESDTYRITRVVFDRIPTSNSQEL